VNDLQDGLQEEEVKDNDTDELSPEEEELISKEVNEIVVKTDPPSFQERINKLVRKYHTAEKKGQKAGGKAADLAKALEDMTSQNRELYNAMMQNVRATESIVETREDNKQEGELTNQISQAERQLAFFKGERLKAKESLDYRTEVMYEDKIEEIKEALKEKKEELRALKTSGRSATSTVKNELDAMDKWVKTTPWYYPTIEEGGDVTVNPGYNKIMADEALALDTALAKTSKWKGVPIAERLNYVRTEIEKKFKVDPARGKTTVPNVEGGGLPPSNNGKVVKLSEEEKIVAHNTMPHLPPLEAEKYYLKYKK
jgi:CRISPR/Cas system CSM-associated protein Csm2 small subunit